MPERGLSVLAATPIRFNLSHAATLAAVTIATGREVGIDIEDVRPIAAAERIAARHLPAPARDALARTPPVRFARDFLQAWTRREAALKALGVGLVGSGPDPGGAAAGAGPDRRFTAAGGWATADLALGREHVGALAVEAAGPVRVVAWRAEARGRGDPDHPFVFERAEATASWT